MVISLAFVLLTIGSCGARDIYLPAVVSTSGSSLPYRLPDDHVDISASSNMQQETSTSPVIDGTCHAHEHHDYMGDDALVWGLDFHLKDAGECCEACKAHATVCGAPDARGKSWWPKDPQRKCNGDGRACNLWVSCNLDRCFSFDIHNHTKGECWLKWQKADPAFPKVASYGTFPEKMRQSPREIWPWAVKRDLWPWEMPKAISWTSGSLAPAGAKIVMSAPNDNWRQRWCDKYGPCEALR